MILASLVICSVYGTAVSFNQEYKDILYALDELDQDFASVPMITENINMFIGVVHMNMQMTEKKLLAATKARNKALLYAVAATVGNAGVLVVVNMIGNKIRYSNTSLVSHAMLSNMDDLFRSLVRSAASAVTSFYAVASIYDAFKAYNTLKESLELDAKIMDKLQDLRESLAYAAADENTGSVGDNLLNSSVQG